MLSQEESPQIVILWDLIKVSNACCLNEWFSNAFGPVRSPRWPALLAKSWSISWR